MFGTALRLGLTSFGGPIAHLGYFQDTYVRRLGWLRAEDYAGIVALCQMLPGPTSSQVGFLVGLRRAGWPGAIAAWLGFTLPSAVLMYLAGVYAGRMHGPLAQAALHGLQLAAVAIVAQAVWLMARTLCRDVPTAAIALATGALALLPGSGAAQLAIIAAGALGGIVLCRPLQAAADSGPGSAHRGGWALVLFALPLLVLPAMADAYPGSVLALTSTFYRAGALVFGGGHVVLPLLHEALVSRHGLAEDTFLSGYGVAQALPGPLFAVAAYFGAVSAPAHEAAVWALAAVLAVFLPGLLLAATGHSLWAHVSRHAAARSGLAGINAAVVGLLGAALYDPVWTGAVHRATDAMISLACLALLLTWQPPPILVVMLCVTLSTAPLGL